MIKAIFEKAKFWKLVDIFSEILYEVSGGKILLQKTKKDCQATDYLKILRKIKKTENVKDKKQHC